MTAYSHNSFFSKLALGILLQQYGQTPSLANESTFGGSGYLIWLWRSAMKDRVPVKGELEDASASLAFLDTGIVGAVSERSSFPRKFEAVPGGFWAVCRKGLDLGFAVSDVESAVFGSHPVCRSVSRLTSIFPVWLRL